MRYHLREISILVLFVIIFFSPIAFSLNKPQTHNHRIYNIPNSNADSIITTYISEINPDTIEYFIQTLEDYGTRYALAPNRFEIANWLKDQFIRFGFSDVALDSFEQNLTWPVDSTFLQVNVIATLPGIEREDDIYILGGHYDAITNCHNCDPMLVAPGADDNASGTAAVLEIARVIKRMKFQPEPTIKFICFASEEIGAPMTGAFNYAEKSDSLGMNIKVMINHDMIATNSKPTDSSLVNIIWYSGFEEYREYAKLKTFDYTVLNPVDGWENMIGDAVPFARLGFPVIWFFENEFSPHYHEETDLVINLNMDYCAEVTRASMASIISFIGMPSKVDNFSIVDIGDGQSLLLNWSLPADEDLAGYLVSIGTDSGAYDTTYSTSDTTMIIDDLTEGIEYFIGITAYDVEGYESFLVEESGTPNSLPLSPSDLIESPLWHQVKLNWSSNLEYDLLGYNIYRSLNEEEPGDKLNTETISDTVFIDETAENGVYYYYTVKSVDNQLNESINNIPVKSRSVSLDQGIVLVDESSDGNGTILNPSDEQVDEFYTQLLERFERENFDIIEEEGISLKDLGAFSTVIWHGSDFRDVITAFEIVNDIQKYLDYGGNLIYSGFLPSEAFEGNTLYPADFQSGDFIYDYLKIEHVENIFGSRFAGALPLSNGYSSLYTDSSKTSPNANYHLPYIEGISANPEGTEIYLYESYYDTSSSQGSMKEEPVGVEYIGEDYKAVTLSFPLYYMTLDESKALIEYILINKFSEVVSIETPDDQKLPDKFVLEQNYPNPFNPTTAIGYRLTAVSDVKLDIYNTLGQKVATLVSARRPAGNYTVEWDASGYASGIYYYELRTDNFRDVKKMVFMK